MSKNNQLNLQQKAFNIIQNLKVTKHKPKPGTKTDSSDVDDKPPHQSTIK